VSEVGVTPYSRLRFTYRSITPETLTIVPRLRFDIDVHHAVQPGQPAYNITLSYARSELKIISKEGSPIYACMLVPDQPLYTLPPASSISSRLYADFDHYRLAQIEKMREGKDIQIQVELAFIAEVQQQPPTKQSGIVSIRERIPKSDWVEIHLPQLRFKDVVLLEVPKIEKPEFGEVISKINEAWKQYSMGEYDKVLTECRKAMEALTTIMKNKGFQKEITDEKGKRVVPDWEKVLAHKEMGDIIEAFVQKLFGFLAPGSHYGKSINREDAELAIMNTHALVNYMVKKL
jgi:hypothetical protein